MSNRYNVETYKIFAQDNEGLIHIFSDSISRNEDEPEKFVACLEEFARRVRNHMKECGCTIVLVYGESDIAEDVGLFA